MPSKTKEEKPEKSIIKQGETLPEMEVVVPKTLRTEYNFLRFPFFSLSKNTNLDKIHIEDYVETKEGRMKVLWAVTRNVESKFPGDFEKRLHRAIEQVINITPKPIENPLRLGSLRQIAELMGISSNSGKNRNDIKDGFKNIVKATIETEGTYQVKESPKGKKFINDVFHLYDRVVFTGEELPNGSTADAVYLMLGSWYLKNINANYVVPLDWHYYNQLKGSVATRMYEFMNIHFFTALERGYNYVDMKYSNICDFFPLVRNEKKWQARNQLKKAHESLIETGYFENVEILDIVSDPRNWILRYHIGPRAIAEYQQNKKGDHYLLQTDASPLPLPERRHKPAGKKGEEPLNPAQGNLVLELTGRDVSASKASELVQKYAEQRISDKLEVFDYLIKTSSNLIQKNPPGWLVKAIENDYAPPPGFISKAQKARNEKEKEELEIRFEEKRKRDEYQQWIDTSAGKKIWWELEQWKSAQIKETGKAPTPDQIAAREKELISALPTNEEKQIEIFGKVIFPPSESLFD